MQIWKRKEKKPFHIGQVSQKDIKWLSDNGMGCGSGELMEKLLPQFTFKYSCVRHDIGYFRGGAVKDKLGSDWVMFRYITIDTLKVVAHIAVYRWWGAIVAIPLAALLYMVGLVYIAVVVTFGWILFNWGPYTTLGEIKRHFKMTMP